MLPWYDLKLPLFAESPTWVNCVPSHSKKWLGVLKRLKTSFPFLSFVPVSRHEGLAWTRTWPFGSAAAGPSATVYWKPSPSTGKSMFAGCDHVLLVELYRAFCPPGAPEK